MKERLKFRLGIHVGALLKTIVFIGAALCLSNAAAVIGYTIDPIPPGDVLIANQLSNGTDTLNSLFRTNLAPSIPDGTSFTKWDSAAGAFLPVSYYAASSDSWSINYTLTGKEGFYIQQAQCGPTYSLGKYIPASD